MIYASIVHPLVLLIYLSATGPWWPCHPNTDIWGFCWIISVLRRVGSFTSKLGSPWLLFILNYSHLKVSLKVSKMILCFRSPTDQFLCWRSIRLRPEHIRPIILMSKLLGLPSLHRYLFGRPTCFINVVFKILISWAVSVKYLSVRKLGSYLQANYLSLTLFCYCPVQPYFYLSWRW